MSNFKKFIRKKWFIYPAIAVLALLLYTEFNQLKSRKSIDREINDLKKQADALQKNNQQLTDFIEYFKTDSYKEKVARQQLNLKKPGEVVYSFSEAQANISEISAENAGGSVKQPKIAGLAKQRTNAGKWFDYFFSKK